MAKCHTVIPDFRKRIHNNVIHIGDVMGNDGAIAAILKNQYGVTWFLQWKNSWFRSFSYVCKVPGGGVGQSFGKPVIVNALKYPDSWLVAAMPINGLTFYGIKTRDAINYIEKHHTWNKPQTETEFNGSVSAKELVNLEKL